MNLKVWNTIFVCFSVFVMIVLWFFSQAILDEIGEIRNCEQRTQLDFLTCRNVVTTYIIDTQ